jgi:hypothetical protein
MEVVGTADIDASPRVSEWEIHESISAAMMSGSGRLALSSRLLVAPKHRRRRIVFEPEPSRWEAANHTGVAERPAERRKRRSQHVEVEVESPTSPATPLRVAVDFSWFYREVG